MSDLFTSYQRGLSLGYVRAVHEDNKTETPKLTDDLISKIQLRFSDSDQAALDQIRQAARRVIDDLFAGITNSVDQFYASFRRPMVTPQGVTVLDARNRIVWAVDEQGRYVDDFSSLSGQDVEEAILKIQRDKIDIATQVNELFLEALFAKYTFDDNFHARYESLVDGTINDRNARATRDTKQEKYLSYFKFYVYHQSETLISEIANLLRLLERVRQWRVTDRYSDYGNRLG